MVMGLSNVVIAERYVRDLIEEREMARSDLATFFTYIDSRNVVYRHTRVMIEQLERIRRREINRLILNLPPGHGKSQLSTRTFPLFMMATEENFKVLLITNNRSNARKFSRNIKDGYSSPRFRVLFDDVIKYDHRGADSWSTMKGAHLEAVGRGSSIQGLRANLLLIDDLIPDERFLRSKSNRDSVFEYYTTSAESRLAMDPEMNAVIITNTRWHDDDLIGRLLSQGGDGWHVVNFPAINDDGEALWPEAYPLERLILRRSLMSNYAWNAMYQQNPIPDDGTYFRQEWIKYYNVVPEGLDVYGASDYAATDMGGDFTELGIIGVDKDFNIYILDWWRGQKSSDVWIEEQCRLIRRWNVNVWFGEAGQIKKAIEPFLKKRMQETMSICRLEWLPSVSSKEVRARTIQGLMSMGLLRFPEKRANRVWPEDLIEQLLRFPNGNFDDAVDVLSLFGRGIGMLRSKSAGRFNIDTGSNFFRNQWAL